MCGCLLHAPYWEPGPQPRHLPWLGIELVTFWLAGQYSIHWATPARADVPLLHAFAGCFLYVPWPEDWTRNLGVSERCSNQLSYPARAQLFLKMVTWSQLKKNFIPLLFFLKKLKIYFFRYSLHSLLFHTSSGIQHRQLFKSESSVD